MFLSNIRRKNAGFTLIELLVVIAIIGILASVVLASLNSARKKGRDARRVADIKQIQLGLELYYDAIGKYPEVLLSLKPAYLPAIPQDPLDKADYLFNSYTGTTIPPPVGEVCSGGATCISYHIGASMEESTNPSLNSDVDQDGNLVKGADDTGCAGTLTTRYCYDVRP